MLVIYYGKSSDLVEEGGKNNQDILIGTNFVNEIGLN